MLSKYTTPDKVKKTEDRRYSDRSENIDNTPMSISPVKESNHKKPGYLARKNEESNQVANNPIGWIEKFEKDFFKGFDDTHKEIEKMFKGFGDVMKMPSIMDSFGGLLDIENEIKDMEKFSNLSSKFGGSQGPYKVMTKSYVHQTKLDPSGRKYEEKYFSNDYAMKGDDGTTVEERQQGYRNTNANIEKIAEERSLNGRGKKLIQERRIGERDGQRMMRYKGMDENMVGDFDRDWEHQTKKLGFYNDFGKMLGYDGTSVKPYNNNNYYNNQFERRGFTNDDLVPNSRDHNRQRSKQMKSYNEKLGDIQPTYPGRSLPMGPVYDRTGNERRQLELEAPRDEGVERRYQPAPISGGYQRNDGNFYNRNAGTSMPRAG